MHITGKHKYINISWYHWARLQSAAQQVYRMMIYVWNWQPGYERETNSEPYIWCIRVISNITVIWDAMQLAVLIGWVDEKTYFRGMWCWADGRMGGKWHRNADEAVWTIWMNRHQHSGTRCLQSRGIFMKIFKVKPSVFMCWWWSQYGDCDSGGEGPWLGTNRQLDPAIAPPDALDANPGTVIGTGAPWGVSGGWRVHAICEGALHSSQLCGSDILRCYSSCFWIDNLVGWYAMCTLITVLSHVSATDNEWVWVEYTREWKYAQCSYTRECVRQCDGQWVSVCESPTVGFHLHLANCNTSQSNQSEEQMIIAVRASSFLWPRLFWINLFDW